MKMENVVDIFYFDTTFENTKTKWYYRMFVHDDMIIVQRWRSKFEIVDKFSRKFVISNVHRDAYDSIYDAILLNINRYNINYERLQKDVPILFSLSSYFTKHDRYAVIIASLYLAILHQKIVKFMDIENSDDFNVMRIDIKTNRLQEVDIRYKLRVLKIMKLMTKIVKDKPEFLKQLS